MAKSGFSYCRKWSWLFALLFFAMASLPLPAGERVLFVDVTKDAGITWVHDNGMSPDRLLPETMNGGCAFLDFDQDGWLDIYLVTGSTSDFYQPEKPPRNALYRNLGNGTFADVTETAGVPGRGFGMGVAAGDYDNDGWPDLIVTGTSESIVYHNQGDRTFREVTGPTGIDTPGWSTSAAWFDFNNDGWLDLWVSGYVIWKPELNHRCGGGETPRYCIPTLFDGWPSWLFQNRGDGTFQDISRTAGIAKPNGKGLGVVTADIDGDGLVDVFESNDTAENFLFRNRGDGTFEEIGLISGVAFSQDGRSRSGMGVDAQDFDSDGKIDLAVANIDNEDVSVYRNLGNGIFEDAAQQTPEIPMATRYMSSFGLRFVDFDNDGDFDLVLLNGHPDDQIDFQRANIRYKEHPLIFENVEGTFADVSKLSGPAFNQRFTGRALAQGDFDNDGDSDLLFLNNGQAPALVRNDGGNRNNWLGLHLVGKKSNRSGVGARITYEAGGKTRYYTVAGGGSYHASHDPRVILGFGSQPEPGRIVIEWPSGTVDVTSALQLGRYNEVIEGSYPAASEPSISR